MFLLFIFSFLLSLMVKDIQKSFLQPPQSCTLSVQHSIRVLSSFFIIINAIEPKSYKGLHLGHLQSIQCHVPSREERTTFVPPFCPTTSHYPDNVLAFQLCLHFTSRWIEIMFFRILAVRYFLSIWQFLWYKACSVEYVDFSFWFHSVVTAWDSISKYSTLITDFQ